MTIRHLPAADPFLPAQAYDLTKFYVSSGDERTGKSSTLRLSNANVPQRIVADMVAIIEQRKVPDYRTKADIVRDALYHRLHWIGEQTKDGPLLHDLNIVGQANETSKRQARLKEMSQLINDAREACGDAFLLDDYVELAGQVVGLQEMVDALQEPYAGEARELLKKFAPLVPRELRKRG